MATTIRSDEPDTLLTDDWEARLRDQLAGGDSTLDSRVDTILAMHGRLREVGEAGEADRGDLLDVVDVDEHERVGLALDEREVAASLGVLVAPLAGSLVLGVDVLARAV
jgi:hypothetical protein